MTLVNVPNIAWKLSVGKYFSLEQDNIANTVMSRLHSMEALGAAKTR